MEKKNIYVTRPDLPDFNDYTEYLKQIWENRWLTNNGTLFQQFEKKLSEYLGVKYLLPVSSGTLALQIAEKVLNIKNEVITTPFTFVATTSSFVWEGCKPVFADINRETFVIDENEIEKKITEKTTAIVPVHVFGNPCNIEKIDEIAKKHNLKVIYDAAHAFGIKHKGTSILNYGDASILSFHATKLFHTIEGGAIAFKKESDYLKTKALMNFGYENGEIKHLGINAKMNEFQAAMGLCMLKNIDKIVARRKEIFTTYYSELKNILTFQKFDENSYNYSYVPVLFENENQLLKVQKALNEQNIYPRRYFYPSLNTLSTYKSEPMPISENVSSRILCLPTYSELTNEDLEQIINIINKNFFN